MTRGELCKVMNDTTVSLAIINQENDCYSEHLNICDSRVTFTDNISYAGNGFGEEGNGDISDWL